jgi:hypothetical protein
MEEESLRMDETSRQHLRALCEASGMGLGIIWESFGNLLEPFGIHSEPIWDFGIRLGRIWRVGG